MDGQGSPCLRSLQGDYSLWIVVWLVQLQIPPVSWHPPEAVQPCCHLVPPHAQSKGIRHPGTSSGTPWVHLASLTLLSAHGNFYCSQHQLSCCLEEPWGCWMPHLPPHSLCAAAGCQDPELPRAGQGLALFPACSNCCPHSAAIGFLRGLT